MMRSSLRLLMTTQVVNRNHPILGFSHTWITKIAQRVKHLHVVPLEVGEYNLPDNVTLWSLGKEHRARRLERLLRHQWAMVRLVLGGQVDGIFCQQTEINVILAAPYAMLRRVPIVLFKGHSKSLCTRLKIANALLTRAITSTPAGYPIDTWKKIVIGQGIDTDFFQPFSAKAEEPTNQRPFRLISVGRVSPIKKYEVQSEAARILVNERRRQDLSFHVYGGWDYAGYDSYYENLCSKLREYGLTGVFHFEGSVPFTEIPNVYRMADVVMHSCDTESLDKTVLEAMSCGVPVVTSIQSYRAELGPYADAMVFDIGDARGMADRIEALLAKSPEERRRIGADLRSLVIRNHSVDRFADKLVALFEELRGIPKPPESPCVVVQEE